MTCSTSMPSTTQRSATKRSLTLCTAAFAALVFFVGPVAASTGEVKLKLPVRARLDLEGRSTIASVPFLIVDREGEGQVSGRDLDVQGEFER